MSEEQIQYLGDVQRLVLKPGDRVILSIDAPISSEIAARIRGDLEGRLEGHQVIVLSGGMRIGILGDE